MNPETWLHQFVHNITMYHLYILIRDIEEDRQPEYLKCYAKIIEPSVIEFLQFLDSYKITEVTQIKTNTHVRVQYKMRETTHEFVVIIPQDYVASCLQIRDRDKE